MKFIIGLCVLLGALNLTHANSQCEVEEVKSLQAFWNQQTESWQQVIDEAPQMFKASQTLLSDLFSQLDGFSSDEKPMSSSDVDEIEGASEEVYDFGDSINVTQEELLEGLGSADDPDSNYSRILICFSPEGSTSLEDALSSFLLDSGPEGSNISAIYDTFYQYDSVLVAMHEETSQWLRQSKTKVPELGAFNAIKVLAEKAGEAQSLSRELLELNLASIKKIDSLVLEQDSNLL